MNTFAAELLAKQLMLKHGLTVDGWSFVWDGARRRFGVCKHDRKQIGLSRPLTSLNTEAEVKNTILHEIAHALAVRGHGHDSHWKAICCRIGARPERCYGSDKVAKVAGAWVATCPGCNKEWHRHKVLSGRRRYACPDCCRKFAGGRFSETYFLDFRRNVPNAVAAPTVTVTKVQGPPTPAQLAVRHLLGL
jgi:predicted SprT family Zn-dependent metalloprotease